MVKRRFKNRQIFNINFADVTGIEENTLFFIKGIEIGKVLDVKLDKNILSGKSLCI